MADRETERQRERERERETETETEAEAETETETDREADRGLRNAWLKGWVCYHPEHLNATRGGEVNANCITIAFSLPPPP